MTTRQFAITVRALQELIAEQPGGPIFSELHVPPADVATGLARLGIPRADTGPAYAGAGISRLEGIELVSDESVPQGLGVLVARGDLATARTLEELEACIMVIELP